jgi:uncharacterized Zn finger protein
MASRWWSQRLVELLHSYGLGGRMERGRRYARKGQLVDFVVEPGVVTARVQGSRPTPYTVTVAMRPVSDQQWANVEEAMRARVAFAARLLDGEVPPELEQVFGAVDVDLFPARWGDLRAACSCPDTENPCKHVAAVLYVFADRLDDDPWLLLTWRGRTREQLLGHLRAATAASAGAAADDVAPWWPLVPDARLPEPPADRQAMMILEPPSEPAAALRRCDDIDVQIDGRLLAEILTPAYEALTAPAQEDAGTSL